MVSRTKYRKVTDLYVLGTEVVLMDGSVMWVQALNPFQRDEAHRMASAARSRFQLAMKEYGSDELTTFLAEAGSMAKDAKARQLAEIKASEAITKVITELEADDEWAEVKEVLDRSEDLQAGSEEEQKLVKDKTREYMEEVQRRVEIEREYLEREWLEAPENEVDEALSELWVDGESNRRATHEYEVAEVLYGARVCDGVLAEDGTWDHSECEGHRLTAYESREEVRELPEGLYQAIREGFDAINMHPIDPKGSGSLESSSESSPLPNEQEDSSPSTPAETSNDAPGTSK